MEKRGERANYSALLKDRRGMNIVTKSFSPAKGERRGRPGSKNYKLE